jgi:Beta-lactamase enzyme family
VPDGVTVAHKHGWSDDTHGDAGLVFTPGGDFVLSIAMHNRTWLLQSESFPAIAEITRRVYNLYNPEQPMEQTDTQPVPLCSIDSINALDPRLIGDLQSSNPPALP